jgi:transcriptional regulator with XRE-family HTH domain
VAPCDSYSCLMAKVSTFRVRGADLRALRTRRGLSLRQLAALCPPRHAQSIRKLETATGKPVSEVFAYQIANALAVDVTAFTDAPADDEQQEQESAA